MESLRSRNERLAAEVSRLHTENKILKSRIRKYVAETLVAANILTHKVSFSNGMILFVKTPLKGSRDSRKGVQEQRGTDNGKRREYVGRQASQ